MLVLLSGATRLPTFMGGSSLGGLICAYAALELQDSLNGLLLFSPAMDVDLTPVMRIQSFLGPVLDFLAPQSRMVAAVRVEDMSEDEQVRC
jgi:alpha-beta hydrolase superfamily lysophospholipase